MTGAYDEAYQWYHRAYRLSPGAPDAHESLTGLAMTEFMRGNDEAAIEWAERDKSDRSKLCARPATVSGSARHRTARRLDQRLHCAHADEGAATDRGAGRGDG